MKYKLIIEGKELTDVFQASLKWFYKSILNGKSGPFKSKNIDNTTKAIMLVTKEPNQLELFK